MWCFRLTTVSTFVYDLKIMVTYLYPICSDLLRCCQRQPLKYFLVHIRMDSSEIGKLKYGMPNCIYKKGEFFNEMLYLEAVLSPMAFLQKPKTHLHQIPTRKLPPVATESPETNKTYQQPEFAWGFQRCTENRRCSMAFLHSKKYAAGPRSERWRNKNWRGSKIISPPTVDGRNPANQLRLVVCLIIYKVLYIPGGCLGFLASTVGVQNQHWHHPSHAKYRLKWA